jgi:hypothetical protein
MISVLARAQGNSRESPLPLWERERVRGLAPAGADEPLDASTDGIASRCRASPLTLSLSHKGRGDSVEWPCVISNVRGFPLSLIPSPSGEGTLLPG